MKTNQDLLGNILAITLLFLMVICGAINGWKSSFLCFFGYVFTLFTFCLCLCVAEKIDSFLDWCNQSLKDYKLFGITFKFFSYKN